MGCQRFCYLHVFPAPVSNHNKLVGSPSQTLVVSLIWSAIDSFIAMATLAV